MKTSIGIDIAGCFNNAHVNVRGQGWLDPESGRLDLSLEANRAPAHWDLALLPVVGLDPLLAMAGGVVPVPAEGDVPAPFRSRSDLFDENDREMGEMVLSGEIRREGDGVEVAGQLLRCETRLEMGEAVGSVEVPSLIAVMPAGPDRILLACGTGITTRRGNGYWAAGTSWMRGADPGSQEQIVGIRSTDLDRASDSRVIMRASIGVETA